MHSTILTSPPRRDFAQIDGDRGRILIDPLELTADHLLLELPGGDRANRGGAACRRSCSTCRWSRISPRPPSREKSRYATGRAVTGCRRSPTPPAPLRLPAPRPRSSPRAFRGWLPGKPRNRPRQATPRSTAGRWLWWPPEPSPSGCRSTSTFRCSRCTPRSWGPACRWSASWSPPTPSPSCCCASRSGWPPICSGAASRSPLRPWPAPPPGRSGWPWRRSPGPCSPPAPSSGSAAPAGWRSACCSPRTTPPTAAATPWPG